MLANALRLHLCHAVTFLLVILVFDNLTNDTILSFRALVLGELECIWSLLSHLVYRDRRPENRH